MEWILGGLLLFIIFLIFQNADTGRMPTRSELPPNLRDRRNLL